MAEMQSQNPLAPGISRSLSTSIRKKRIEVTSKFTAVLVNRPHQEDFVKNRDQIFGNGPDEQTDKKWEVTDFTFSLTTVDRRVSVDESFGSRGFIC